MGMKKLSLNQCFMRLSLYFLVGLIFLFIFNVSYLVENTINPVTPVIMTAIVGGGFIFMIYLFSRLKRDKQGNII